MPTYKLTYFNLRGKAETIRLVFAAAGVDYEDNRISKEWCELKSGTPFGQVPILEIDGTTYCQSDAIARYLARKFDLAGKSELDQLRADMVVDCLTDIKKPALLFAFEKDEVKREEGCKKYVEEKLPAFLTKLEQLLAGNHDGGSFFVGSELTWADLSFLAFSDWATGLKGGDSEFGKHSKLVALRTKVQNIPKIAAWLEKRPQTEK